MSTTIVSSDTEAALQEICSLCPPMDRYPSIDCLRNASESFSAGLSQANQEGCWNPSDPTDPYNRIRDLLKELNLEHLKEIQANHVLEMRYTWCDQAALYAMTRTSDKQKAQAYAMEAMALQDKKYPHPICKIRYLLICDELEEAEEFMQCIQTRLFLGTARSLIETYKAGRFFPS